MYAWHECRLDGAGAEARMLIELLACPTILLQGAPDSLDGVRGCRFQIGCLSKEASLYFYRKGRNVLFCREGAICVSIDCYNPARSGHFELDIGVMWHRIESIKCGLS